MRPPLINGVVVVAVVVVHAVLFDNNPDHLRATLGIARGSGIEDRHSSV
jgi:hypothetical protein